MMGCGKKEGNEGDRKEEECGMEEDRCIKINRDWARTKAEMVESLSSSSNMILSHAHSHDKYTHWISKTNFHWHNTT